MPKTMPRTILRWMIGCLLVFALAGCAGTGAVENEQENNEPEQDETRQEGEPEQENDAEGEDGDPEVGQFVPEDLPQLMLDGEYERIYEQTSAEFQNEVGLDVLVSIAQAELADVSKFDVQTTFTLNGLTQYTWIDEAEELGIIAAFSEDDIIQMLLLQPVEADLETDDTFTETEFILPFRDEWFVYWGGTNTLDNYHYAVPSQRYAYDFIRVQENRSYEGSLEENESYYAFGADVIAPADGTVVTVVDGIDDNEPVGTSNTEEPAGNYVVIDHGNGEFSHLAHFQNGTNTVQEGDRVRQGDLLGQCGNSGNSSEAHIHFHVADGPDLYSSQSIRIRFKEEAGLNPEGYIQGQYAR
jgi:hypothetical protein